MKSAVRRMDAADLLAVLQNERLGYTHPWSERIFKDCLTSGDECWLLELGGHIVGHGVLSVAAGESHLLNVCVQPDCQGKGFGRMLVEHLLARATERDATVMFLEVRASNVPTQRLYEKLGFNEVGVRKDYYPAHGGREDALVLAKELLA